MIGPRAERTVIVAHFPNGQWQAILSEYEESAVETAELLQYEFGAEVWVQLCIAGDGEKWSPEP